MSSTPWREEPWHQFVGPNLGYVIEQYEKFLENPNDIDQELREFFEKWGSPPENLIIHNKDATISAANINLSSFSSVVNIEKFARIIKLAVYIRTNGHLHASVYPLENKREPMQWLDFSNYQLEENDLKEVPAKFISPHLPINITNGLEGVIYLAQQYAGSIAFEFNHVHNAEEHDWLTNMVESGAYKKTFSNETKKTLLRRLSEVEGFEHYIHKTYVGQKRFSIEGLDMLVPLLDEIIDNSVANGTPNINIGMAHRGRLNVLAHVLRKPYENIFSEFQHAPNKALVPSEGSTGINYGWSGDVKYHLGADRKIKKENTVIAHLTLANNPSHLEFVNPIVVGYTRAGQDNRQQKGYPKQDNKENMAILIHGDAAFIGEGIVSETLNLANLNGYHTGGSIHIIANNRIGFTTARQDSRSTKHASDLAKGFEMPIIHVNADDPEAVLTAGQLATAYRNKFHKDILINLVGYRRYGHNEMDEPAATQPIMYEKIRKHPTIRELYANALIQAGIVSKEEEEEIKIQIEKMLQEANEKVSKNSKVNGHDSLQHNPALSKRNTGVSKEILQKLNEEIIKWPEGFNVFSKLKRIYSRRAQVFNEENKVDWSLGEALAFATILRDGTPIRMTGQDSERGTFAHRHLVLHDTMTGDKYSPLHRLSDVNVSFAIHNSPLSEGAVLGFEYGYNIYAKDTLTIWEAQFGDFANTAQVIIDQFIAAGQAKWGQQSGLVMLLPHAYEGQGPEHSSGRVERFLQLSAENNWIVANVTTAAQYFHLLRRQAALLGTNEVRPLVLMTPKSLLRNPFTVSNVDEFVEGSFEPVLPFAELGKDKDKVERIVLCSGKIATDLAQALQGEEESKESLHILKVEEIYPFPKEQVLDYLNKYKNVKELVWVQEEPMNMGSWSFVEPKLREIAGKNIKVRYIGRKRRSSPAEGDPTIHKKDQERIITESLMN